MRVRLKKQTAQNLFAVLLRTRVISELAQQERVSIRTIYNWSRGRATIPLVSFRHFVSQSGLRENELHPRILAKYWHVVAAARKGGHARVRLHGNPGTVAGRRKGGQESLKTHRQRNTGFRILHEVALPPRSSKLAELLGILVGDGHLSYYQASVCTNLTTDIGHAYFVKKLFKELFAVPVGIQKRQKDNSIVVVVSSRTIVRFLEKQGMPSGNKIKNNLRVPDWILKKGEYRAAFMRGLFDTDGCVYAEHHSGTKKTYSYAILAITSYAKGLIYGIIKILNSLGFTPRNRSSQKSVYLRKQSEVRRYFSMVGTSNPKHLYRFNKFIGRVPKRS